MLFFLHIAMASVLTNNDVETLFLRESGAGWRDLIQALDGVDVEYSRDITKHRGDEKETHRTKHHFCVFVTRSMAMNERQLVGNEERMDIEIENPSYSFRVSRSAEDSGFYMTFHNGERRPDNYSIVTSTSRFPMGFLSAAFFIAPFSLPEMMEDDRFQLVSVNDVSTPDERRVRVHWQINAAAFPDGIPLVVEFLPERSWAIRSYFKAHPSGAVEQTVEYQNFGNGLIPKRVTQVRYSSSSRDTVEQITEVDFGNPQQCLKSPSDFYASTFGLPEPGSASNRYRTIAYILAAIVVLAVLIRRVVK